MTMYLSDGGNNVASRSADVVSEDPSGVLVKLKKGTLYVGFDLLVRAKGVAVGSTGECCRISTPGVWLGLGVGVILAEEDSSSRMFCCTGGLVIGVIG